MMASKSGDPLLESLMQLAATAAPLIRKARDAGLFRPMDGRADAPVDAEVVTPQPAAGAQPGPTAAPATDAQIAALHDIIVRQALQIRALEAEVAAMKAAAATPPA
jgi:hypothetical protein